MILFATEFRLLNFEPYALGALYTFYGLLLYIKVYKQYTYYLNLTLWCDWGAKFSIFKYTAQINYKGPISDEKRIDSWNGSVSNLENHTNDGWNHWIQNLKKTHRCESIRVTGRPHVCNVHLQFGKIRPKSQFYQKNQTFLAHKALDHRRLSIYDSTPICQF